MKKKILIVDDDPVTVHWLSRCLQAKGYSVVTASDGRLGLETARQMNPDLIVLDVMLPELNGFSVCGFLRTDPVLCDVPLIMITARQEECDPIFDEQFSPNAFLKKPLDMDQMFEQVAQLI